MGKRPKWAKRVVTETPDGRTKVQGVTCFVVAKPNNILMFQTCRRKMKHACMAFEEWSGRNWEDAAEEGFKVMKLYGSAWDKTDQSLMTINDWVETIYGENDAA